MFTYVLECLNDMGLAYGEHSKACHRSVNRAHMYNRLLPHMLLSLVWLDMVCPCLRLQALQVGSTGWHKSPKSEPHESAEAQVPGGAQRQAAL